MIALYILLGMLLLSFAIEVGVGIYLMSLEIKDRKLDIKEKEKRLK